MSSATTSGLAAIEQRMARLLKQLAVISASDALAWRQNGDRETVLARLRWHLATSMSEWQEAQKKQMDDDGRVRYVDGRGQPRGSPQDGAGPAH